MVSYHTAERVGPLGAAQLAELLAYNTSVEGLDLRGLVENCCFMSKLGLLTFISLKETGLSVDGANRIAEMLHVNSALTSLDLACESLFFQILL